MDAVAQFVRDLPGRPARTSFFKLRSDGGTTRCRLNSRARLLRETDATKRSRSRGGRFRQPLCSASHISSNAVSPLLALERRNLLSSRAKAFQLEMQRQQKKRAVAKIISEHISIAGNNRSQRRYKKSRIDVHLSSVIKITKPEIKKNSSTPSQP